MMTKAEAAKMRRLEAEVAALREQMKRHMKIYSDQSWELVKLRSAITLVQEGMTILEKEDE